MDSFLTKLAINALSNCMINAFKLADDDDVLLCEAVVALLLGKIIISL